MLFSWVSLIVLAKNAAVLLNCFDLKHFEVGKLVMLLTCMSIQGLVLLLFFKVQHSSLMEMVYDGYFAQNTDVLSSLAGDFGT